MAKILEFTERFKENYKELPKKYKARLIRN
jgi:hypothetical protein